MRNFLHALETLLFDWPSMFNRMADPIFGYDFFIWFDPRDGDEYPLELARNLASIGYRVFVDNQIDESHRPLAATTRRLVKKSRYVLIIGSKHALNAEYALKLIATDTSAILIDVNKSMDTIDASHPLYQVLRDAIHQSNQKASSPDSPSPEALASIQRAFTKTRQEKLRGRTLITTLLIFIFLALWFPVSISWQATQTQKEHTEIVDELHLDQLAIYNTNYAVALVLEQKAQAAATEGRHAEAWLYTLSALQKDIGPSYALPESHGALFNTAQIQDVFMNAWESPGSFLGKVSGIKYSPDGNYIAARSNNHNIVVWNAKTGKSIATLRGHTGMVKSIAFSPDGHRIASGARDNTWRLWDTASGELLATYNAPSIYQIAFSPDGRRIATTGTRGGYIKLWSTLTGEVIGLLNGYRPFGQTEFATGVDFSADGKYLAAGYYSGKILVIDTESNEILAHLNDHTRSVEHIAFSPDSQQLLSGSLDGTLKIWDIHAGIPVITIKNPGTTNAYFSPYQKHIVTGNNSGDIQFWDAYTGELLRTLGAHNGSAFFSLSPDGSRIVSGSADQSLKLWDAYSGVRMATAKSDYHAMWDIPFAGSTAAVMKHSAPIYSVAFSPDGQQIISGSGDHSIQRWDAMTGKVIQTMAGQREAVFSVAYSQNGELITTASGDNSIGVRNGTTGEILVYINQRTTDVTSMTLSYDSELVASGSQEGTIRLWNTEPMWESDGILRGHTDRVTSLAFSADGKHLASGSVDRTLLVWDVASKKPTAILEGHSSSVLSVTFVPGTRYIASGSYDGTIHLWDADSKELLALLEGHTGPVHSVAVSPNGKYLVSGSGDQTVRIWNLESRTLMAVLRGHTSTVRSVAFSPSGRHIVSGSEDATLRLWDTRYMEYRSGQQQTLNFQRLVNRSFDVLGYSLNPVDLTLQPLKPVHFLPVNDQVFSP